MPTNRNPLDRGRRRRPLSFDAETLALFVKLDGMKARTSDAFKAADRELARRLDLIAEWWTCNSVLDRSAEPCHPPGYISYDDWFTCREYRTALLAAVRKREATQEAQPATEVEHEREPT